MNVDLPFMTNPFAWIGILSFCGVSALKAAGCFPTDVMHDWSSAPCLVRGRQARKLGGKNEKSGLCRLIRLIL
jgi:hypothetical protein